MGDSKLNDTIDEWMSQNVDYTAYANNTPYNVCIVSVYGFPILLLKKVRTSPRHFVYCRLRSKIPLRWHRAFFLPDAYILLYVTTFSKKTRNDFSENYSSGLYIILKPNKIMSIYLLSTKKPSYIVAVNVYFRSALPYQRFAAPCTGIQEASVGSV